MGRRHRQRKWSFETEPGRAEFCRALLEALARSEKVCQQEGILFRGGVLKAELERELATAPRGRSAPLLAPDKASAWRWSMDALSWVGSVSATGRQIWG
ncbi:MAG: hypothetical protein AAF657_20460 [Acidobacteriota bacterium]